MQGAHGQQSRAPIPNISRCAALHSDHKQKQLSRGREEERQRYLCPCDAALGRGGDRETEVGTPEKNQELLGAGVEGIRPDWLEKRKKKKIDWRRRGSSHGLESSHG